MPHEGWKSRFGFVITALGSAVGLVNIWRFPYVTAQYGGAAFLLIYFVFLLLIGYPVLLSELLIGRTAQTGPGSAFRLIEAPKRGFFSGCGKGVMITGLLVASFYSVVAGWILGYFVRTLTSGLSGMTTLNEAQQSFTEHLANPLWCVGYHIFFMILSTCVLYGGVRRGLERSNKIMMPLLFLLLLYLVVRGLGLPHAQLAFRFLFTPNWSLVTPMAVLTALGHAFFTLSLGQGTMITYGGYLDDRENIPRLALPIVAFDTLISIMAGVAILAIVFSAEEQPVGGMGLLFSALPSAFSLMPGGAILAPLFFFLVILAALTSQSSALEPMINYLTDQRGWRRHPAVLATSGAALLLGIPSALSFSLWSDVLLLNQNIFGIISFLCMDILIPLGGLVAVLFVGWFWGFKKAYPYLRGETPARLIHDGWLRVYLGSCILVIAPLLILVILITNLW